MTFLNSLQICTFKEPNLAEKRPIWRKIFLMLNSAEFIEFVFSKSGGVGVGGTSLLKNFIDPQQDKKINNFLGKVILSCSF